MTKHLKEIFYFGIAGVIGYFIDVAITSLLIPLFGVYVARIPAFVAAATSTWIVNRSLTFKNLKSRHSSLRKEYLHYLSLMIGGAIVNYTVYAVAITFLEGAAYDIYLAVALGSLAGMMVNYLLSRRYIYSGK